MKRKRKRISREELLRNDPRLQRLKGVIERHGGKAPMTEEDSAELTRRLEARLAQGRRREAS